MLELATQPVFRDKERAAANLAQLARDIPAGALARVRLLLGSAADPDTALHYLVRFREAQPAAFQRLAVSPAGMQYLVAVFSSSRFLSEALLRHPEWIELLPGRGDLHRVITTEELEQALEEQLEPHGPGGPPPVELALFRRRQLLRILVRDLLGFGTLAEITEELSNLADAILDVTYRRIRHELARRYGRPRYQTPAGEWRECGFSILALGKLGGQELNYSSDIDLMFVYSANGQTEGRETISNREFFCKLANHLTDILSTHTAEGKCYRVDLRLRPEGRLGEVCISVDGARAYYEGRARDWELQMLIKARVAAGERAPGQELLDAVEPLIYKSTLDFSAVESVSETRERISEKAAQRRLRAGGLNVKLARGGIRDIEFLVQCLQRLHGGREPWVRRAGTRVALRRLRDKELLSDTEYSRLASAYEFLRHLEHRLQFLDDRQTHELPASREELDALARRMPGWRAGGAASAERLLHELNAHLEEVQEIYERVIHAQQPIYYGPHPESFAQQGVTDPEPEADFLAPAVSNLVRFLDERAPSLAATIARSRLRQGAKAFEHFLEHVLDRPHWLSWLDSDPVLAGYVIDLFEHSSHFAEQLVRKPELVEELKRMREAPGRIPDYAGMVGMVADAAALRRFYWREMLRIQAESICLCTPIFDTLKRTSQLADAAIGACYQMALEDVLRSQPPSDSTYQPRNQMVVIALGRLGMMEFDLASDADLVFVLPDRDAAELPFWTRVAERMIQIITAYTGEGVLFAVDTRLRPNGREGMLVQTAQAFKDYFASRAEAWEGITYMKSRAVAGDLDWGTKFLNALQEVDWRRWGQSGRSRRKLWEMRMRLEKEQGPANPLKAGRGGYYDIDFALMYLRLKAAGFFFPVLNTPERIEIIEKMGHLDREDAAFLLDAATFYRAVDHGLRVYSGQAEGNLPKSRAHLEALQRLVSRWTPEHLHDQPLDVELAQIQARTREYFERLFG
jgi:glutamate-ammonia-ligase adenylyltransferase